MFRGRFDLLQFHERKGRANRRPRPALVWRWSLFAAVFVLVAIQPAPAAADCFDDAGAFHSVNPWVMRAIVFRESRFKPNTVTTNRNRSNDFGLSGINTVHLEELAKFGIGRADLLDPCKSIYVGAWHYRKKIKKYGNTWKAVGAYRNENPELRDEYSRIIRGILENWINNGTMPAQLMDAAPQ